MFRSVKGADIKVCPPHLLILFIFKPPRTPPPGTRRGFPWATRGGIRVELVASHLRAKPRGRPQCLDQSGWCHCATDRAQSLATRWSGPLMTRWRSRPGAGTGRNECPGSAMCATRWVVVTPTRSTSVEGRVGVTESATALAATAPDGATDAGSVDLRSQIHSRVLPREGAGMIATNLVKLKEGDASPSELTTMTNRNICTKTNQSLPLFLFLFFFFPSLFFFFFFLFSFLRPQGTHGVKATVGFHTMHVLASVSQRTGFLRWLTKAPHASNANSCAG